MAGNGPSLRLLETRPEGPLCTVNAGLSYFYELGWEVDLHWIQDRRMMTEKPELVEPYLELAKIIAYNSEISYFRESTISSTMPIHMLGYKGFSKEPGIGVFHGYTAIYGLLQILYYCKPAKLSLYGVGLNYFSNETRFYQSTRGVDVDLHRANEQVKLVSEAIRQFEFIGIPVDVVGASMLKRASYSC